MIPINKAEEAVYEALKAHQGMSTLELTEVTGMNTSYLITITNHLSKLGLIRKEGNNKNRSYYAIDVPTRRKEKGDFLVGPPEADELLEQLTVFTFNAEQLKVAKANMHLPRRELAKLLGIPKLELNIAMERMGKA